MHKLATVALFVLVGTGSLASAEDSAKKKVKEYRASLKSLSAAKKYYATLNLNPIVQTESLSGVISECIAEVNVGTAIDVACSIPPNAKYNVALQTRADYNQSSAAWTNCETSPNFLCPGGSDVSWWGLGWFAGEGGRTVIQARVIPIASIINPRRARIVVHYGIPASK